MEQPRREREFRKRKNRHAHRWKILYERRIENRLRERETDRRNDGYCELLSIDELGSRAGIPNNAGIQSLI